MPLFNKITDDISKFMINKESGVRKVTNEAGCKQIRALESVKGTERSLP